jgi:dTDP-4-amino-4,6-dideoxygalactose transaminase
MARAAPSTSCCGANSAQRIWLSSPHLGDEETAFVEEAFRTNWIAPLGPHVDGFERELAALVPASAMPPR